MAAILSMAQNKQPERAKIYGIIEVASKSMKRKRANIVTPHLYSK